MGGWIQGDLIYSLHLCFITSNFYFYLWQWFLFQIFCSIEFTQTQDTFRYVKELHTVPLRCIFPGKQKGWLAFEWALLRGLWVTPNHPLTKGKMIANISWWKTSLLSNSITQSSSSRASSGQHFGFLCIPHDARSLYLLDIRHFCWQSFSNKNFCLTYSHLYIVRCLVASPDLAKYLLWGKIIPTWKHLG